MNQSGGVRFAVLGLVIMVVVIGSAYAFYCPCERVPGMVLLGEQVSELVQDWGFANEVRLCQIQVSGGLLPHAINLNCMSSAGALYVSCSRCEGKMWSSVALDNPYGWLRLGEKVYPVHLQRLQSPQRLDVAWQARSAKLGVPVDQQRPDHWWSFSVTSR